LAGHQRQVPGIGVPWGLDVDLLDRDHVAPVDHRLQVEAPARRQQVGDPVEEVAIDLLLAPGGVLLRGAEVLERAEAGDGVEGAKSAGVMRRASWRWTSRP